MLGYDVITKVKNRMTYESFKSKITVKYRVSVSKAKYYYDCGRIYIGTCESWRYKEYFKIDDICNECTNHYDTRPLSGKWVNVSSNEWYDKIEFQKSFSVTIPAGGIRYLKIFLPDELRFGHNAKYTSTLQKPEIIDVTYSN